MSFDVFILPRFNRELKPLARKYRSLKNELLVLVAELKKEPTMGVPLGRGFYKIRLSIASKGKGKSGGARIVTHVVVAGKKVYLLSIFDKSERDNITDEELKDALREVPK